MIEYIAKAKDFISFLANRMVGTSGIFRVLETYHSIIRTPLLLVLLFTFANSASASLEITDFFSDYTSSEVTIRSTGDHYGKAVFELLDGKNVVETQEVILKATAGEEVARQTDRIITMQAGMIASDTGSEMK